MNCSCDGYKNPLTERNPEREDASVLSFAEELVYRLPGCPDITVRKALMDCWRQFADKTSCWKERPLIPLAAGGDTYAVPTMFGAAVKSLEGLAFCKLDDNGVRRGYRRMSLFDAWHDQGGMLMIRLADVPSETSVAAYPYIEARVVLLPNRKSESAPQWVLDIYGPALAAGALYRLASQTNKPWGNAELAAQSFVEWNNALNRAAIRAISPSGRIDAHNYEGWA